MRISSPSDARPTRRVRSAGIGLPILLLVLIGSGTAAGSGSPPPIPTVEQRHRLVEAEQARFGATWEQAAVARERETRAIHDDYDVQHYDIALDLDIPNTVLTGYVQIEAASQITGLTEIELDLLECMTVDQVSVNGVPAAYTHAAGVLTVTLDAAYDPGATFDVRCGYHGTPYLPGGPQPFRWLSFYGVPMILSYAEPYGAPAWWVCKDDPKDKATYGIHITCPDSLFAVSNGVLDQVVDHGDGRATYDWRSDYPMSTYLFSIAVTVYAHWSEVYIGLDGTSTMDVHYWTFPVDSADATVDWSRNVEMIEFYAGLFGEYPFLNEKYAIAEFMHPGAMEHQTATSMGWQWITGTHANDWVVAHELAHSWVGDMITMTTWSHAWCKEGFATYCEPLWFEPQYGEAYYHAYMASMNPLHYGQYQLYDIDPPLHAAIYYKGAWVLHMLRHVIADTAFFDAIYGYANDPDFRYGVADTEDLRGAFEDASGMDLTWFFDQWIYHPGYPVYGHHWWAAQAAAGRDGNPGGAPGRSASDDGDPTDLEGRSGRNDGDPTDLEGRVTNPRDEGTREGYDVHLRLVQRQELGPLFKMPIDVVVTTDLGDERFVIWDSLETQDFVLHVTGQPLDVEIDPDVWIIRALESISGVSEPGGEDPRADGVAGGSDTRIIPPSVGGHPNPCTRGCWLRYELATASQVSIDLYDVGGRHLRRLLHAPQSAGAQQLFWDGTDENGRRVPSGVYGCRFATPTDAQLRRLLVLH